MAAASSTKPNRVLHACAYEAGYRGAFIGQLVALDEELQDRGWLPSAFIFPPSVAGASWVAELRSRGCSVSHCSRPSKIQSAISAPGCVKHEVAAVHATVVHSHFGDFDAAAVSARKAGAKVVWHYRAAGPWAPAARPWRARVSDWLRYRRASRHVDLCIALNSDMAQEIASRGMQAKVLPIDAGIDVKRFASSDHLRSSTRSSLGIDDDELMILHMGWEWHRKGGDVLVDALNQLSGTEFTRKLEAAGFRGIRAVSVGAGSSAQSPVVSLSPTEQVEALHVAADIFVSASRREAFGNALAEAMAAGCPVVATDIVGQRTLVKDQYGAILVPPGSVEMMARAISDLVDRRTEWKAMGQSNFQHVSQAHNVGVWASAVADQYEQLTRHCV